MSRPPPASQSPASLIGAPDAGGALSTKLAWLTGIRLVVLVVFLGLTAAIGLRSYDIESFTPRVAFATLVAGFVLAAGYGLALRTGKRLDVLADVQLLFDQVTWTLLVYLSGGAASGAASLYGLTCVVGAILSRFRGASVAALAGALCYGALVVALELGLVPLPPDQPPSAYQLGAEELAYHGVLNLTVIVIVMLLAGYLAERLEATGGRLVEAEARAEQAERMAALGQLAAGLAHEIRNPLGSIAGSIQLLATSSALDEEDKQLCEIVSREASRLNDLVTDMMDLARPREPQLQTIDAGRLAREVVELAGTRGRAVSDVKVQYEGLESARVTADPGQLRQLIWNLVRNAVQASSAGDAVSVSVQRGPEGVRLTVADDGIGIEPEARERLFDAFFTTRSKGTGVGLAVVKRIADEHGFQIDVESEAGEGAIFNVFLGPEVEVSDPL